MTDSVSELVGKIEAATAKICLDGCAPRVEAVSPDRQRPVAPLGPERGRFGLGRATLQKRVCWDRRFSRQPGAIKAEAIPDMLAAQAPIVAREAVARETFRCIGCKPDREAAITLAVTGAGA